MKKTAISLFLILMTITGAVFAKPEQSPIAKIDQLVAKQLTEQELNPNAMTTDEVFVRRIHLDLIGRIPTRKETRDFLASEDPIKRAKLINSLIGSNGYVSHQYNFWADLLRARTQIAGNGQSTESGYNYERWIKSAIRHNKPYNEMVYELVTASGASWENPAVGYYLRDYGMPLDNLAMTTQTFLGTQVVCAQCHDHPFEEWTQMDYYHLSAFTYGMVSTNGIELQNDAIKELTKKKGKLNPEFSRDLRRAYSNILFPVRFNNVFERERALRLPHDYQYEDARPKSVVSPATLMGNEAVMSPSTPLIDSFGEWLVSKENPRFTKVIANRMWKKAMGVGLIEPVDDIKQHTKPSNPELMAYLEQLMVDLDYDLQKFQRILYNTRTYQREVSLEEPTPGKPYYFAGPILRRMTAEQIWDSLVTLAVNRPDEPDARRELRMDESIAKVKLVAEALYDQTPKEFLRNGLAIKKVQDQLAEEILASQEKVAKAREDGDPELTREALREVNEVRRRLTNSIEEIVYREGLESKMNEWLSDEGKPARSIEVASAGTGDDEFLNQLALTLDLEQRSFTEGMKEITGKGSNGLVNKVVAAMFEDQRREVAAHYKRIEYHQRESWEVETPAEVKSFKGFQIAERRLQRASELNSPAPAGHFLREFGQSDRELIDNSSDQASITQALAMLNGPALSAITNRYSVLGRAIAGQSLNQKLDTIYMAMLSRIPTDQERKIFKQAWASDPESGTTNGIVWTMLNTRQFLFIQ